MFKRKWRKKQSYSWPRWTTAVVSPGFLCKKKSLCWCRGWLQSWWFAGWPQKCKFKAKICAEGRENNTPSFKLCSNLFPRSVYLGFLDVLSHISMLFMLLLEELLRSWKLHKVFSFLIFPFQLKEGFHFCKFQLSSLAHQQLEQDLGPELEEKKLENGCNRRDGTRGHSHMNRGEKSIT